MFEYLGNNQSETHETASPDSEWLSFNKHSNGTATKSGMPNSFGTSIQKG